MKYRKSLLIRSFEEFYLLLLAGLKQVENGVFFSANDTDSEKESKVAAYQNRLYVFIKEKDAQIASEFGKVASDAFSDVIYTMLSLADELFLSKEWDGKVYWRNHLMEQRFFYTSAAGQKLLLKLDKFLQERHSQDNEMGTVYLYALALGFKGKLRYADDIEEYVQVLKEQIFYTIYQQAPRLYKQQSVLFSQATDNIFAEQPASRDTRVNVLKKLLFLSAGLYLIASSLIWNIQTRPTWNELKRIEDHSPATYVLNLPKTLFNGLENHKHHKDEKTKNPNHDKKKQEMQSEQGNKLEEKREEI